MTFKLGVIGFPVSQSISPAFQQAALDHMGIDARYELWETTPNQLVQRVTELRSNGSLGFNVTVPHKEAIFGLLDGASPEAQSIGAVNVVVREGDQLVGYNTDAIGFLRALREEAGFDPKGLHVLVLGAGGAARAVCFALIQAEVSRLSITNRTDARAHALVAALSAENTNMNVVQMDKTTLAGVIYGTPPVKLIVNCTSLGMRHGLNTEVSPIASDLLPFDIFIYDLIYNPPQTPLLKVARSKGAMTLGGLSMLVYQGAEAFRLWTGLEPPVNVMREAAEQALK